MNELALFAGSGGGILASKLLGWNTICAVEINEYCRKVLLQRQRDKILPRFPIWDDIRTFDGKPWRGKVDIVTGGFPCKDISQANKEQKGLDGRHSGLWFEFERVIREVRPTYIFIENVPNLRNKGLRQILQFLAYMGYNARWGVLGASDIKAPHQRKRMWVMASNPNGTHLQRRGLSGRIPEKVTWFGSGSWWSSEPGMGRVDNGMANRVDRLKSIGNGQVPIVASIMANLLIEK